MNERKDSRLTSIPDAIHDGCGRSKDLEHRRKTEKESVCQMKVLVDNQDDDMLGGQQRIVVYMSQTNRAWLPYIKVVRAK